MSAMHNVESACCNTCDISSLLFNTPLYTYFPTIYNQSALINFTYHGNTGEMPFTILLVAKKVLGIDFPIDHETYPEDCKNVACTKIEGRYRPRSWILVTQRWDNSEEDFMEVENYTCIECAERNKRSFNGERIIRR